MGAAGLACSDVVRAALIVPARNGTNAIRRTRSGTRVQEVFFPVGTKKSITAGNGITSRLGRIGRRPSVPR